MTTTIELLHGDITDRIIGIYLEVLNELGHGYHNLTLAQRTMLQRDTPMTSA